MKAGDVVVKIRSRQRMAGGENMEEIAETTAAGTYYLRDGTHYLLYGETLEEGGEPVRTMLRLSDGRMEVVRRGAIRTRMRIEEGKKTKTLYETPLGALRMEIAARRVQMEKNGRELKILAGYALEIDGSPVLYCEMEIRVFPKGPEESLTGAGEDGR